MELKSFGYGYAGELALEFDEAIARVKEALARHGFGIQAEIPISEALKNKIGVDVPREVILGACNPTMAHQAMQLEPEITVLLPCNVTVRAAERGVHVGLVNPKALVGVTGNPDLEAAAAQVESALTAAMVEI